MLSSSEIVDGDGFSNSSDDYDDNPLFSGKTKTVKNVKSLLEKNRRNELTKLFEGLQQVIRNGDSEVQSWSRSKIITQALKLCQDLVAEENNLRYEMEILFQENWKLKNRIARITRRKKRKSNCATLTNRVSSLSLSAPEEVVIPEVSSVPVERPLVKSEFSETKADSIPMLNSENCEVSPKPPRRKYKQPTGLSEEEREFYMLNEKIESLLHEVNTLWDEVKDDEEYDENEDDLDIHNNENEVHVKSEEKSPTVSQCEAKSSEMPPSISSASNILEIPRKISVTDITKLMEPKFIQNQKCHTSTTQLKSNFRHYNSSANDSSGDESPRLVIDEGESPRDSDQEVGH